MKKKKQELKLSYSSSWKEFRINHGKENISIEFDDVIEFLKHNDKHFMVLAKAMLLDEIKDKGSDIKNYSSMLDHLK